MNEKVLAEMAARKMAERSPQEQPKEEVSKEPETKTEEPKEEPKEQPVAETIKEEPTEQPKEEPKAETPKEEPKVEEPAADNKWEEEKEKYEAQIKELTEKAENKPELKFANERIKKLNDLAEGGVDIDSEEFWKMQALDLGKFNTSNVSDGVELLKLELKASNPDLTDAQVDRLVQRKYKPLFDETFDKEDEEYKDAELDLTIDAKKAQTTLQKLKDEISLPKVDLSKRQEDEEREEEEKRQRASEFNNMIKEDVSEYSEQNFKVGDVELKFTVDDTSKKMVEAAIVNSQTFFEDNYISEDGEFDLNGLKEDMLLLANKAKIFKMFHDQGLSAGKESVVDDLENTSEVAAPSKPTKTTKSFKEQIGEQVRKIGR